MTLRNDPISDDCHGKCQRLPGTLKKEHFRFQGVDGLISSLSCAQGVPDPMIDHRSKIAFTIIASNKRNPGA